MRRKMSSLRPRARGDELSKSQFGEESESSGFCKRHRHAGMARPNDDTSVGSAGRRLTHGTCRDVVAPILRALGIRQRHPLCTSAWIGRFGYDDRSHSDDAQTSVACQIMSYRHLHEISKTPLVRPQHLKSLTAVRFFAAFWVVIYHFCSKPVNGQPVVLRNFVHLGFIGVGFFFVLSGFVLTYVYGNQGLRHKMANYFVARFARIYPVYFLSFVLAFGAILLDLWAHRPVPGNIAIMVPTYLLMLQTWVPAYSLEINVAAWTLSVELAFYVLFPFLLPSLSRMNRKGAAIGMIVCAISTLIVPSIAVEMGISGGEASLQANFFNYFPLIHVPAFLFGAFLARFYESDALAGRYARWPLALGLAMLVLLVNFDPSNFTFYIFIHDGGLLIPFGLVIYGLAAREGIAGRSNVPNWLVLLGDASFGIYILQFPVYIWTNAVFVRAHIPLSISSGPGSIGFAAYLCGLCVLIYRYLELPAREAIRAQGARTLASRRSKTAAR
jgi:peptidoglycan/LPS O-acetylase OafA/YrhL